MRSRRSPEAKSVEQVPTQSQSRWSRLPTPWIRDGGLKHFTGRSRLGASVAALKILVAILLSAENNSATTAGPNQGSASLSYDELMDLTGLSRASVAAGVKHLVGAELVTVRAEGRGQKNRYVLKDYGPNDHYTKLANNALYRHPNMTRISVLCELSTRSEADMNALKLYLLLCATVDRRRGDAMISYERINEQAGIPEAKIRQAISVLIEHRLIDVDREKATPDKRNHPNRYIVLGL